MRHIISDPRGNPVYTSFGSWRSYNINNGSSSRSYTSHYNPRSILISHVKSSDWNSVIHRAKTHPPEIMMVDDNGNTALHVACQLDPPVNILISLKEAATQTNSWGATPLHIAASHRCNAKALKKLIDFFPGALSRLSRMHRTAIHYACMSYRGLDLVAFQVLLEQTLVESRRLKEEQYLHHHDRVKKNLECDLKISDFIDIIQETEEDIGGDDMLNDEEISVLIIDNDSQHAMPTSPSGSVSTSSSGRARLATTDQREEDENISGSNKNNYNVVTWKDTTGKTPLGLLFRRYRERVRRVIEILDQMRTSGTSSPRSSSSLQADLGHLWGKARLIVVRLSEEYHHQQDRQRQQRNQEICSPAVNSSQGRRENGTAEECDNDSSASGQHWSLAASWSKERFSNRSRFKDSSKSKVAHDSEGMKVLHTEERQFQIVHASVGLTGYGCPPEMIRLAISIYPHQVREMDEDGNLPLHIAATALSLKPHEPNNPVVEEDSSVFSDSIVSLFSATSTKNNSDDNSSNVSFDKVIKLLLKQYPQAAQTPHGRSGRLPLVLADRAGDRTWNDGMKTLLRAYPPALFSGSKGIVSINLYPHILSLIGGGDPPEPRQTSNPSVSYGLSGNATSSLRRNCPSNRFKGHGGIGILHNLLLLKQRHMKELMSRTVGTSGDNTNHFIIGRQSTHAYSTLPVSSSNNRPVNHQDITRRGERFEMTSTNLSPSPSKYNNNKTQEPDRKRRKEYATTMFELLRAKPDLIETTRSHQVNLTSGFHKSSRSNTKISLPAQKSIPKKDEGMCCSQQPEGPQGQRLSKGRKKIMSLNLLERMRVFERKTWKSVQHVSD